MSFPKSERTLLWAAVRFTGNRTPAQTAHTIERTSWRNEQCFNLTHVFSGWSYYRSTDIVQLLTALGPTSGGSKSYMNKYRLFWVRRSSETWLSSGWAASLFLTSRGLHRAQRMEATAHFLLRLWQQDKQLFLMWAALNITHIHFWLWSHNWKHFQTNYLKQWDIIHHRAECNYYRATYSTITSNNPLAS